MSITDARAEQLARLAYNTYGGESSWIRPPGKTMQPWEQLTEPQRAAWVATARAVADDARPAKKA